MHLLLQETLIHLVSYDATEHCQFAIDSLPSKDYEINGTVWPRSNQIKGSHEAKKALRDASYSIQQDKSRRQEPFG